MTQKTIAEFVSQLNSLDVEVFVEGDRDASLEAMRLRCTAPEGTLTTALRQELADRKAELVSYLSQEGQRAEGRRQRAKGRGQGQGQKARTHYSPQLPTLDSRLVRKVLFPLLNSACGSSINSLQATLSTMCLLPSA
jgi:hypothetical protein